MYKCKECERVFAEPHTYGEDRTPYGCIGEIGFTEYYLGCPECGGAYKEVFLCECCNKYVDYVNEESICEECEEDE